MDKKQTAKKPVTIEGFIDALVGINRKAKFDLAKQLHLAIKAGFKPSVIARKWAEADPENAKAVDFITKYSLAYGATLNGADFDLTLKALNSGELKRETATEWQTDNAEIYPEFKATEASKPSKGRKDSDPAKASEKALNAIVARVKADNLTSAEAIKLLNKAIKQVEELARVSGNLKRLTA